MKLTEKDYNKICRIVRLEFNKNPKVIGVRACAGTPDKAWTNDCKKIISKEELEAWFTPNFNSINLLESTFEQPYKRLVLKDSHVEICWEQRKLKLKIP